MLKKSIFAFALVASASTLVACNDAEKETETNITTTDTEKASETHAIATLSGTHADTTVSGTAKFTADGDKVSLELQLSIPAMANKSVAVHIHENGSCDDGGKAAGAHWNPTGHDHGKWGENGHHSGDIGNVDLDGEGNGTLKMDTDKWSVGGEAQKDILNKAVIVHSGSDDFKTQPTGNAGGRIGCGVIQKGK